MPVHGWTRVDAGPFHDFHQRWISALRDELNSGVLPPDFFALAEQSIRGPVPDVLTLKLSRGGDELTTNRPASGLAVAEVAPHASLVRRTERGLYAHKADRLTVRHHHGEVVAVIEIVSPGNKGSTGEFRAFIEKSSALIQQGVNLLVIDLFPPTRRDPGGIHKAIWDEFEDEDFTLPADKPLVLAAFDAGPPTVAYVEPVAVGDRLPDMPLFLRPERYVQTPLEATYQASWRGFPGVLKGLLETP